ncbi:MAG: CarD family transcriptional regulator [Clostridia bacterium]|nr:CarD family transcriptional regulator [Clostridia bacterium]
MFSVGDKIVHPFHGAGVIQDIVDIEVLGEVKKYYTLALPFTKLKLDIPVDTAESIGVRPVMKPEDTEKLYEQFKKPLESLELNWNRRHKENLDKLRSGDILQVAEVYKYLRMRDKSRSLSTGEKKLYSNSRNAIISEIILATGATQEDVMERIDSIFKEFHN